MRNDAPDSAIAMRQHWRLLTRHGPDNLQPLFYVNLHVQRSENRSDNAFVDAGRAARSDSCVNLRHALDRNVTLRKQQLRDALVPVMNAFVV